MKSGAFLLLVLASLTAVACYRAATHAASSSSAIAKASSIDLSLLRKIIAAPTTVAWSGTRRYESHFAQPGAPVDLIYDETVTTDGAGRFELRADDLITPTLDPNAEALFLLAQENRESLMFRHRDATVRDEALFLQNYTATDAGVVEQVLGRDCARWSVQANAGGNVWTLWIDLTTGVVLRWEELNAAQTLVARLEYLTFDDAPDTSQAVWHTNPLQETALDRVHPKSQLGFDPLQPKLLPAGFQLASAEHVVESVSGRTWARFTYTDGWAELVFMDGGPMTVPQTAQGYAPDASVMRIATVGSWVVADGRLGDRRVLSAARGSADQLQALVESAVQ